MLTAYFLQPVASFDGTNGASPVSGVVMDTNGDLFGTTYNGGDANGDGTIFEIAAGSGAVTTLAEFDGTDGSNPWGQLLMDSNGDLFGTALGGGDANGDGTIFELPAGSSTIVALATFDGTNGSKPYSGLLMDANGDLFGTTFGGGDANNDGTIFELPAGSGTIDTLAEFGGGANGANPIGDLYTDANGDLFGTTYGGGDANGDGTIFELPAGSGTISIVATFDGANGSKPIGGLTADADGNLYGTTSAGGDANGDGVVFELPLGAASVTPLAEFDSTDGATGYGPLFVDADGNLYGTTSAGGDASGDGVVFEVAAGSGAITTLATLGGANGAKSYAGLITDTNGDLIGTTIFGGDTAADPSGQGYGTVFELVPIGPPAMLSFVQQPALTPVGEPINPAVTVDVDDANGHLVQADNSDVTLSVASPDGSTLDGTLTVAAIDGVATFSDLSLPATGSYTLEASDGALTAATSNPFTVTNSLFTVDGNGTTIADGETSPSAADFTDFGQAPLDNLNGSVTRTFTIQNISDTQIDLTGTPKVTISGANAGDFTVTTQPASSISSEGSTTFTITFKPTADGLLTAQVNFASSDSSQNPFTFDIQGTGLSTTNATDKLQIATTQSGTGSGAVDGQELNVLYTGMLLDGTVFDASSLHGDTTFALTLGAGQVIKGWDLGLVGMKVGETRILIIPAALGYGASGSGPVPANATLIFQVQLVSITGPTLGVTGLGTAIASGDATLSITDGTEFGDVAFGHSVTHTFDLSDLASAGMLELTGSKSVTISGPDASQFSVTQPSLGSGQTGSFNVTYKPKANEEAVATITIASNDPDTPALSFDVGGDAPADLSGTFASTLKVPASLAVGNSLVIPVTVTNTGLAPAIGTIDLVAQASPDGNWNVDNPTLASRNNVSINLAPGASETINLTATIPDAATLPLGAYTLLTMIQPVTVFDDNSANNVVSLKGGAAVTLNITPVAPTGLTPTPASAQVSLTWNATANADSYNVKRSTASAGPYTMIATGLTSPSYVDTTVTNGTTYYYVVSAVGAGLEGANSAPVHAEPEPASRLVFVQQPENATAGVAIGPAIVVKVENKFGLIVNNDSSNVTLAVHSGPGTAGGTLTVQAVDGVATLSDIVLDTAGSYTLNATDAALTAATSKSFKIVAAAAAQLAFGKQPSIATAGVAPSITVNVEDPFGNIVTTDTSDVTVSVDTGPGALTGTVIVAAVKGVATFSKASLDTAGLYTLTATDGILTSAMSGSVTVNPAAAASLIFVQQPSDTAAGVADSPAITVNVEDKFSNIVTAKVYNVSMKVDTGPGVIGGTDIVATVDGVATFSDIVLNTAGIYTLKVSEGSLSAVLSDSFTVT